MESPSKAEGLNLVYTYRLRSGAETEWCHHTGAANVVLLSAGEGLLFQPNRLLLSRVVSRAAVLPSPETLYDELAGFCSNREALHAFWLSEAETFADRG